LAEWARLVDTSAEHGLVDETSTALVVLLQANPALSAHVAAMGYLSKVLAAVPSERADLQKAAVQLVRVLSSTSECVHAMRSLDCVAPLLGAMKSSPSTAALLLPSLNAMASATEIVEKCLEASLVQFVLSLLSGGAEKCDDPSTVKAYGVSLLKTLAADPRLGAQVQATLDEDRSWDHYKSQEHDLFLAPPNAEGGMLTGGSGGRVGLLT